MNLSAFRLRILGGSLLTATLAVLLVWASISITMKRLFHSETADISDGIRRACRADPAGLDGATVGHTRLYVYGPDGRPLGAGGPLAVDGWRELPVGGTVAGPVDERWSVVTRIAEDGPCAWVASLEGPPPDAAARFRTGASVGVFLALLGVGALSYAFTVTPLLRRIERLRVASVGVGTDGYATVSDPVGDALAQIADGLDRSNLRIEEDRRELVARHEALERWLAEIAHDLRTPLGSLLLAVQEVRAEADGPAARRALTDAAYVAALVENLHQAARMRHGLDPAEGSTDLRDLVLRLEVRFRALGEATGVVVAASVPDDPVVVRCSPILMERSVANLLQNALSHGARRVALQLDDHGDRFRLVVSDDGPGVARPADLAERTFTSSADRPRGPGLGRAITNEIARRAGFDLAYSADVGLRVELSGPIEQR